VVGNCTGDGDCDDFEDCTNDACVANNCVYPPADAGTPCGTDGQCTSDDPPVCTEGACTDQTGTCANGGNPCANNYQCAPGTCSVNGNFCLYDEDCGTCAVAGTSCSRDSQCTGFGDSCTASTETCNGADQCSVQDSDSQFICSPSGAEMKAILTGCGVCTTLPVACPDDCLGNAQNPANGTPACQAGVLLQTPDGICPNGLAQDCFGCFQDTANCGAAPVADGGCSDACSNTNNAGASNGPNGCFCIDCITTSCDPAFALCAGFVTATPNGSPNPHTPIVGGPPVCESIAPGTCDNACGPGTSTPLPGGTLPCP
jgi:hypothetical protein